MGLGQQAPTVAVRGDMGMVPPLARQYREVARQYKRLKLLSPDRLNSKIIMWACNLQGQRTRGWPGGTAGFCTVKGPPLDSQGGGGGVQEYLSRANYLFQPGSAAR